MAEVVPASRSAGDELEREEGNGCANGKTGQSAQYHPWAERR